MQNEGDYAAQEAAEAAAKQWWDDVRDRSLGSYNVPEFGHILIGVALRQWIETHPKDFRRFKSYKGWANIMRQSTPVDDDLWRIQTWDMDRQVEIFFQTATGVDHPTITPILPDNPWSFRSQENWHYALDQVATLEADIVCARRRQSKRMAEENRLRLAADRSRPH
jgi:hypothetical protein